MELVGLEPTTACMHAPLSKPGRPDKGRVCGVFDDVAWSISRSIAGVPPRFGQQTVAALPAGKRVFPSIREHDFGRPLSRQRVAVGWGCAVGPRWCQWSSSCSMTRS